MKKTVLAFFAALICFAALSFAGCGGSGLSEEEQFNQAKERFDNYTVEVTFRYADGGSFNSVLMCDGTKGKLTVNSDTPGEGWVRYYSEDYGKVFAYDEDDGNWRELSYASTIEEASSGYNGYVMIFTGLFYDDFEKKDGYLVAKADALASYGETYGLTISSAKVKLSDGRFTTATAIADDGGRIELTFTFKNYGTTSVTLPQ